MMKIIAVGDIHGRDFWKEVAAKESDFDMFVFVGDYFDNWPPMTPERIVKNFKDILAFRDAHPGKVAVLIGNHDFQYMPISGGTERYSGYNSITQMHLDSMGEWWKGMQPAFQHGDILFSHAGLSNAWAVRAGINPASPHGAAVQICDVFKESPELFKFYKGDTSYCGEHTFQSPFWIRPKALLTDMYEGITHVVGHTGVDEIANIEALIMIDAAKSREYLVVENGDISIGTI